MELLLVIVGSYVLAVGVTLYRAFTTGNDIDDVIDFEK